MQSRHAGAGQPNRLDGLFSLAEVIPAGSLGVGKSLPDDVLKVRVHAGMRAQPAAKEKPHRSGAKATHVSGLFFRRRDRLAPQIAKPIQRHDALQHVEIATPRQGLGQQGVVAGEDDPPVLVKARELRELQGGQDFARAARAPGWSGFRSLLSHRLLVRHRDRLAPLFAQGLHGQPRVPQVDPIHGRRRPGKGPCGAVPGS